MKYRNLIKLIILPKKFIFDFIMNNDQTFSIKAKTCTLKYNSQEGNSIILDNQSKYIIPIYQRPYSWKEEQLRKFISDIFTSYWGNDKNSPSEPMFIGTMQLSYKGEDNKQNVIDGQQRLTTFLLLFKVLQIKFPECKELNDIKFDWLTTQVNSGKQQEDLEVTISSTSFLGSESQNHYSENASFINELINEQIEKIEDELSEPIFNIDRFVNFLLGSIYFVVIETKAMLTKTLQIFNAINTTGLDLNGGDIFKIRMYEYLTEKFDKDESIFEEISDLYKKIDDYNTSINHNVTDIRQILNIYQYILIARYNLPVVLYNYGADRFFEELFDTIMGNQLHEHFKNNVDNVILSLEDIDKIIEIRYEWEHKWRSKEGFNAENVCSFYLIWWSRYSRYWELAFVLLYRTKDEPFYWDNMLYFIQQLNKLFFIYSVRFQKIKSDIYYSFMHQIIEAIVNKSFDEVISLINNKIGKEEDHNGGWYNLDFFLTENLTENAKRKNLICRLSAMLDEDYTTTAAEQIEDIRKNLFDTPIDIEHIQSYLDKNLEKRQDILNEWGADINSLGNLIILEQRINRSIKNNDYKTKIKEYDNSIFLITKNHYSNYSEWDLSQCLDRKKKERKKIVDYLFQ